jgi:hypothetical protein
MRARAPKPSAAAHCPAAVLPGAGRPRPRVGGPATLAGLQRAAGNRATTRLIAEAAGAPSGAGSPVVQRTITVTVRTANPRTTDPVDKVRIAGRPEGFWAGTQAVLGPRGAKQDYRHVVDFDTVKRGRAKELKGLALATADANVQAAIRTVAGRYRAHYVPPAARIVGRDDLRRLEDRLKYLLRLEFNDPGNLWLGASGENRSGGSTAKQLKMKLKSGFRGSKYFKQDLADADQRKIDHFATRLDFTPGGTKDDHLAQLQAFATAYAQGFGKSAKYGDATDMAKVLWNDWYRPEWRQGRRDANHGTASAGTSVPYDSGYADTSGTQIVVLTLRHGMERAVQRTLGVTVRQTPRANQPIEKVRISDRPGKFWAPVEQYLGIRADQQDYRHIVDFDLIRSSWEKRLKTLTITQARQRVTERFRELADQYPRHLRKSMKGFGYGNRPIPLLEQDLKQLMTLEYNNPSNLWVGESAQNRSRGSTAKARKRTLKMSAPASKYYQAIAALAGGQLSAAQREHFENRLDLSLPAAKAPLAKRWKELHRMHLDRFTAFYEVAFSRKATKYGASATLATDFWNAYTAAWQQGYDDKLAKTFNDASTSPAYQAGGWDCVAEFQRGYLTYRMAERNPNPAYTRGRLAAWRQFDRGFNDARGGANPRLTTDPYTTGYDRGRYDRGHGDGLAGRPRASNDDEYRRGHAAGVAERQRATGAMKRAPGAQPKGQPATKKRKTH